MNTELALNNNLNLENIKKNIVTAEDQNSFLESNFGKLVNEGINLGLKALLPDLIEDQVIEVKDSLITDGFSAALKTGIDQVIDLGKSIIGLFTGKFENISQIQNATKKGGLIDTVSDLLSDGINKLKENGKINSTTTTIIENGKDLILNTINNNIENNYSSQIKSINNIDKYINNWNKYFEKEDFSNMDKQYKKIEKELKNVVPLENVLIKARQLENLHNLIKNKGEDFNLSKEELELANKLI